MTFPDLNVSSQKNTCQFFVIPKLERSFGKHKAKLISTAVYDWSLNHKIQIKPNNFYLENRFFFRI